MRELAVDNTESPIGKRRDAINAYIYSERDEGRKKYPEGFSKLNYLK